MANTSKGRFPSYGLVRGPSHSQGGVPASVANGPDVELEGGEYIIPKEAVPDYLPVLQQITQVGRDRQQMQNGNSAIDALIASASMQNGIAQPKSPVYQEGGQVQSKTLRGSRVVSRDIGRDGDMFTGQVIMAIPADQVGGDDGLRYYLSEPRQSQSMSLLDRKAQSSARRKMAFAPQDSLPADLVEGYFDRQNKTSILDMDNEKSPLGFLKNLIGKEQGGMIEYKDGGEVHSRRMFNQGTGFNKKKSDLDGDGNISEYERKRGMAIAKSMGKMQEGGQVYADKKPISYSAKREDMLYNTGKSAEQQRDIIAQRYIYPTDDDMIFRPSAGPASGVGALKGYGLNLLLNSLTGGATGSYNALAAGLGAVREIRKMGSDKTQVKRMAKGKQPFDPVYFAKDYESGDVYSATRKGWRKLNPETVSNIKENFPDYMKNLEAFNTGFKYRQEQGGPINNYQMGGAVGMQRPMNPAINFSPMQQRNPRMYQEGGQVQPRKQQEMRNPNTFIGPPVNLMGPGLSDYEKAERNLEAFMDSLDRSQDINPFTGEPIDTDADVQRLKERMRQSKIPRSNQRMPMQEGGQVQLRRQAEKNLMSRQPKEKMDVIFPFSENVPSFLYPDFIGPRTPMQNKLLERFLDDMMRNARGDKKFYIDESDRQESGMKIAQEGGMVSNNNLMGSMASDQRIAALQPDIYQSKSENGVSTEQRMEVPKLAEAILPIYGLETPLSKNQGSMLRRNNVSANVLNPQVKGLINRVLVQRLSAESN